MTPEQEAAFEKKAEKMLAGHRMFPNGRDFRCFSERFQQRSEEINEKFDNTFPEAPGSPDSFDSKYCPECDKLLSWCECQKEGADA